MTRSPRPPLPAWATATAGGSVGARHPLRRRAVPCSTSSSPTPPSPPSQRQRGRGGDGADAPTGPWTRHRRPGGRTARGVARASGQLPLDLRPEPRRRRPNGTEYLFYGSYYGGIWVTERQRRRHCTAVGAATQVAIDNKLRGRLRRPAATAGSTCSRRRPTAAPGRRPATASTSGRSRDLRGPVRRPRGRAAEPVARRRHAGAGAERQPLGRHRPQRRRHRPGRSGLDALPRDRPERPVPDGTDGINERPMLLDRLDWVDGWPTVRAGAWASEGTHARPDHRRLDGHRLHRGQRRLPDGGLRSGGRPAERDGAVLGRPRDEHGADLAVAAGPGPRRGRRPHRPGRGRRARGGARRRRPATASRRPSTRPPAGSWSPPPTAVR